MDHFPELCKLILKEYWNRIKVFDKMKFQSLNYLSWMLNSSLVDILGNRFSDTTIQFFLNSSWSIII